MEHNHLGVVDYVVVAGTLLFSIFIGIYYAVAEKQTNEDLLLGGRKMSVLPIACSILVTYLSAITILGYPAEIYAHGIQIFMMTIVSSVFIPMSTYLFVYVFYSMKLTSVYEYLELRFNSLGLRWLAAMTFIIQVVVVTGVVLFAPSIALETIAGLPIWASVAGIGICGTVYTSIGGLKAVVWTDVFQFVMIFTGMVAMVARGFYRAGGVMEAFEKADKHARLHLFDLTVDPFMRHNTLNFILGYGFNVLCLYGTYQPQVQRYCSLPTFRHAVKSILLSVGLNILTMGLVVSTGIAIFATYAGCDPTLLGEIKKSDQIVPYFVLHELAFIPGMMGLFVSCVFSAVLSSLSSILNSLAAVTWQDFLSRITYFQNMSEKGQANTSRLIAVFYGIITIFFAFAAQHMGPVLQACLTAVGATSGPLGAVFLMGLFMPCVNKWGAIVGTVTSLVTMIFIGIQSFRLDKPFIIPLPTSVDECAIGTDLSAANNIPLVMGEFDWPEKIFTLSYIMYPFVGAVLSIIVSLIFSILTGGCCTAKKVNKDYLHPLLRKHFGSTDYPLQKRVTRVDRVNGIHDQTYRNSKRLSTPPSSPYRYDSLPQSPGSSIKS
ncbi:unnamed protein product [Allacma fusca]|uniref:Sodium-coupled monocarboxylate transporter 1 n=1 Tax=Allacma fusca TaxID=39272 RepID=A0A8J2KIM0_9HEXA|nr:unnamed protein product [Allacma fusca]